MHMHTLIRGVFVRVQTEKAAGCSSTVSTSTSTAQPTATGSEQSSAATSLHARTSLRSVHIDEGHMHQVKSAIEESEAAFSPVASSPRLPQPTWSMLSPTDFSLIWEPGDAAATLNSSRYSALDTANARYTASSTSSFDAQAAAAPESDARSSRSAHNHVKDLDAAAFLNPYVLSALFADTTKDTLSMTLLPQKRPAPGAPMGDHMQFLHYQLDRLLGVEVLYGLLLEPGQSNRMQGGSRPCRLPVYVRVQPGHACMCRWGDW